MYLFWEAFLLQTPPGPPSINSRTLINGLNKGDLKNISLLSRKSKSPIIHNLQENVAKVIDEKMYDWKVLRVSLKDDIEYE
jgi:hypothetical protein